MSIKGHRYPCGCVEGYYWCDAHDIYVKQDRKGDPRWNGEWRRKAEQEAKKAEEVGRG